MQVLYVKHERVQKLVFLNRLEFPLSFDHQRPTARKHHCWRFTGGESLTGPLGRVTVSALSARCANITFTHSADKDSPLTLQTVLLSLHNFTLFPSFCSPLLSCLWTMKYLAVETLCKLLYVTQDMHYFSKVSCCMCTNFALVSRPFNFAFSLSPISIDSTCEFKSAEMISKMTFWSFGGLAL